jgi:hypothetical protein
MDPSIHSNASGGVGGSTVMRNRLTGDQIDVFLVRLPRILSDIVTATLERESGFRVSTSSAVDGEAAVIARQTMPDVVILGTDARELEDPWRTLLVDTPGMRFLTVADDGRESFLYELRPYRLALGEVSPQTLLAAVRSGAGESG